MKKNKIDEVLVRKKKRNLVASAAKEKLIVNDDEEKDDQEMLLENIPDFDHVPSDSAEELSESESKTQSQNVTKEEPIKKIYTDFTENTVFVGNLPVTYDKKKVIKAFSRFGSIVCVCLLNTLYSSYTFASIIIK